MDNNDVENTVQSECADYPSACFLLDSCFQDYQRIQDNYNKIYEKINIAPAFSGVILRRKAFKSRTVISKEGCRL